LSLGAGREKKGDGIDYGAGVYLDKTLGDEVQKGEVIARLYTKKSDLSQAEAYLDQALQIGPEALIPPVVYDIIE